MKRILSPIFFCFVSLLLMHCKKSGDGKSGPHLVKGLLANFTMNNYLELSDSMKNVPTLLSTVGVKQAVDRNSFTAAIWFSGGKATTTLPTWKASPITVCMWVTADSYSTSAYFLTTNEGSIGFFQNETKWGFAVSHPFTNSASAQTGAGWTHVAGTYDGKQIRLFIDGKLADTKDHPGKPEALTDLTLASFNNVAWKGGIDELRFYNRILSDEEIALLASF